MGVEGWGVMFAAVVAGFFCFWFFFLRNMLFLRNLEALKPPAALSVLFQGLVWA